MTSTQHDKDFITKVIVPGIPADILGDSLTWIQKNLVPEDVFDKKELGEWAEENGYIKES